MMVNSGVVRAGTKQSPLSKKDIAGIAGQILLAIREVVANQHDAPTELSRSDCHGMATPSIAPDLRAGAAFS